MIRRLFSSPTATSTYRLYCNEVSMKTTEIADALPVNRLEVLPKPKVDVPSFDFTRRMGSLIVQSYYSLFYERNFSVESLVHGANHGIHSVAHFLADEKWDQMENLVVSETVEELRIARKGISKKLESALRFHADDLVISFLHSSIISGRDVHKFTKERSVAIYFTIVSFVRLSKHVPENATINQLNGKYKNDVLVCNATFSRVLNPLSVWKITSVNFFI